MRRTDLVLRPERATPSQGVGALLVCGLAWALLSLVLHLDGHEPTRAPLAGWYRWQAVLVVPWLRLSGEVYAGAARWIAGRLGARADLRGPLLLGLGLPLAVGFVLPDLVVYLVAGFDALWPAMLIYGSVTVLWSLAAGVVATRRLAGLGTLRALVVVVPAWLLQALVASLVLR